MTILKITASTLQVTGTLMISVVLMTVHNRLREEKAIDQSVIDALDKEYVVVVVALFLIALAWVLFVYEEYMEIHKRKKSHVLKLRKTSRIQNNT
jgi:hypothetical protein